MLIEKSLCGFFCKQSSLIYRRGSLNLQKSYYPYFSLLPAAHLPIDHLRKRAHDRVILAPTLTAPLLKELISRINVSEVRGKGKKRIQRIAVHYRFVGYVEMEQDYASTISLVAISSALALQEFIACTQPS